MVRKKRSRYIDPYFKNWEKWKQNIKEATSSWISSLLVVMLSAPRRRSFPVQIKCSSIALPSLYANLWKIKAYIDSQSYANLVIFYVILISVLWETFFLLKRRKQIPPRKTCCSGWLENKFCLLIFNKFHQT
jgi:hypothetical protein